MSKYRIAKESIARATQEASQAGWDEAEILQALLTTSIGLLQAATNSRSTRSLLEYELANVSDRLDLDFIRSR